MSRTRSRRRSRRAWRNLLAVGLAAVAVVGTALLLLRPDVTPPTAPAAPKAATSAAATAAAVQLLLDGPVAARFAGELAASQLNYFATRIDVSARPETSDFVQAIAHQHAIGVTTGQSFLLARWRGAPVTAFAASFLDTSVAVFTLESSGLRRPADLVGRRVGVRRSSEGEVIFDAMMAQLGLPRSQITKVPDRDSFEALRAGEVDAILAPIDTQPDPARDDYAKLNVIKPQDYGIHVPGLVYFASNDLMRDRPSVIADVLQGIIRGWQFVYADYARSVPVLVGLAPDKLKSERLKFELSQQRALVLPTGGRIADYDESRWRTLRDVLIFAKLGEEEVPLADAVSYQFLRDVYRRSPDLGADAAETGRK